MLATYTDLQVERGLPLGLFDPRYARDDNGHMPWQYAQTFHRPDIAEILNPSYDIMLLATGNGLELADWVSIPQLSSLAAGVLQAKLQGELLAAAEQQQRQQQQDLEEALQNGCCSSTRSSGEQQQSVAVEGSSHSRSTSSGSRSANALIATSVHGAQTGAHDAAAFLWGPGGRSRKSDMQQQAGMARLVLPQAPCQLSASVAPVHNSSLHACLRQFEPTDTGPKQQEEVSQLQQLQEHAQQQQNGQASDPGEVGPGVQARQATAVTQDSTKTPIKSLSRRSRSKLEHDEHGRIDGCCGVCWLEEAYVCMQPCQHVLCRTCAWRLSEMMLSRPLRCPFCRRETAGFVHAFTAEHEQA